MVHDWVPFYIFCVKADFIILYRVSAMVCMGVCVCVSHAREWNGKRKLWRSGHCYHSRGNFTDLHGDVNNAVNAESRQLHDALSDLFYLASATYLCLGCVSMCVECSLTTSASSLEPCSCFISTQRTNTMAHACITVQLCVFLCEGTWQVSPSLSLTITRGCCLICVQIAPPYHGMCSNHQSSVFSTYMIRQ